MHMGSTTFRLAAPNTNTLPAHTTAGGSGAPSGGGCGGQHHVREQNIVLPLRGSRAGSCDASYFERSTSELKSTLKGDGHAA